MAAELSLALLGPPVVTRRGRPVSFDTRKATAVLALLAVDGRELSRERLAALLWPEADTTRARASLRRTLSVTAAAAGGGLKVTRTAVALEPSRVRVDVTEFETLATGPGAGPLDQAIRLYRDDFLAGFALRGYAYEDALTTATASRMPATSCSPRSSASAASPSSTGRGRSPTTTSVVNASADSKESPCTSTA